MVAGNWKMNGSLESAGALGAAVAGSPGPLAAEVVVCPPFVHLAAVAEAIRGGDVVLGAQDVCHLPPGAVTGEISAEMLVDAGCRYVIVGHSERRSLLGEDDARVAEKLARALEVGLGPVLCVGETAHERDAGRTEAVVARQLDAVLERCGAGALAAGAIAYEPVWAIGTGRSATPEQAQAVHAFIRARVGAADADVAGGLRILYGGSVKGANAASLFEMPDVDGALVGGASLNAAEFNTICRAAG